MNIRIRRGIKRPQYAQREHKKLHDQVIYEFTSKKFFYLQESLLIYEQEQDCRDSESIQLLKFKEVKSKVSVTKNDQQIQLSKIKQQKEEQQNIEKKICKLQQQMALFENIKSYVNKKLQLDKESAENKNNLSNQEIFELRKHIFNKQFQNERQIFNLDYLPNMKQKVVAKKQSEYYTEYFEFDNEDDEENQKFANSVCFNFNNYLSYTSYNRFKCKEMEFYPSFNKLEDYHKYEDYTQTSMLYFNAPRYLSLSTFIDNPLSLLSTLRILLSLKSYSTLDITIQDYTYDRTKDSNINLINQLIEAIFRVIFNQRSLQLLQIEIPQTSIKNVVDGMSKVNLERSNIRVIRCHLYESAGSNSQNANNFFQQLQRLKNLSHLQINDVIINEENNQNFLNVLNNLTTADLNIIRTQLRFDSPKVEKLKLNYTFYSVKEVHINFENFKNASNLKVLEISYSQSSPSQHQSLINGRISRKQILEESKEKKRILKGNQTKVNENDKKEEEKQESELLVKLQEPLEPILNEIKLDSLIGLKQLKTLNIQFNHNQTVFCSFVNFLKQSISIKNVDVTISVGRDDINILQMNELLPVLDNCQNLKKFSLSSSYCQIRYDKSSKSFDLYSYYLKYNNRVFKNNKFNFNPYKFAFRKVNNVELQILSNVDVSFSCLDEICQSISNTNNIEQLSLNLSFDSDINKKIEKNQFNQNSYLLFSRLANLEKLEVLKINLPFNQNVIDQLSQFMDQSQSIKSLQISRTILRQFYLDYTKLFKSISYCQNLEQIKLNLGIERMNITSDNHISIWEQTKNKYFYTPFCEMLKKSQRVLQLIEFQDDYYEKGLESILKALLALNHIKYLKFSQNIQRNLLKLEVNSEELTELVTKVYERGFLVDSKYQFQLFHEFTDNSQSSFFNNYEISRTSSSCSRSNSSSSSSSLSEESEDSISD